MRWGDIFSVVQYKAVGDRLVCMLLSIAWREVANCQHAPWIANAAVNSSTMPYYLFQTLDNNGIQAPPDAQARGIPKASTGAAFRLDVSHGTSARTPGMT